MHYIVIVANIAVLIALALLIGRSSQEMNGYQAKYKMIVIFDKLSSALVQNFRKLSLEHRRHGFILEILFLFCMPHIETQ